MRVSALLRFEKTCLRATTTTLRLQVISLHFSLAVIEIGVFADDLMHSFPPKNQELTLAPNKQKDFFNRLPIFLRGGYPTPYVDPIRPKVTQDDPRLRESAEGRNPQMEKPGLENRVLKNKLWTAGALACDIQSRVAQPPSAADA